MINDPITQAPTLNGVGTRAWLLDLDAMPKRHATVACWLIEAPWAHPFWHSYRLVLVHLRDDETIPPPAKARIFLPGATHQILLDALDPEKPRQPMLVTGECIVLRPGNFAAQIIGPSDEEAAARVLAAVKMIVAGALNPDTDFMYQWIALFGDNMVKK